MSVTLVHSVKTIKRINVFSNFSPSGSPTILLQRSAGPLAGFGALLGGGWGDKGGEEGEVEGRAGSLTL